MKIDITKERDNALKRYIKLSVELSIAFTECETWEEFFPKIDELIIFNQKQIVALKKDFESRR